MSYFRDDHWHVIAGPLKEEVPDDPLVLSWHDANGVRYAEQVPIKKLIFAQYPLSAFSHLRAQVTSQYLDIEVHEVTPASGWWIAEPLRCFGYSFSASGSCLPNYHAAWRKIYHEKLTALP